MVRSNPSMVSISRPSLIAANVQQAGCSALGEFAEEKMAEVLDSVLNVMSEESLSQVRGIVTDISNYGTNFKEVAYAVTMLHEMELLGRSGWHAVIDTGRNAIDMAGQIWCNANGAEFTGE